MRKCASLTILREKCSLVITGLLLSTLLHAQKQLDVLDWKAEYSLNTYLVQKMHHQYDLRRQSLVKALQTRSGLKTYIANANKRYRQLLGAFPEKADLKPVITGIIDAGEYRIEKLMFESSPSHHVTANFYVPNKKGKYPSVLFFCGHEDISKATESYQQTAILFVQHGFAVLVVDPVSQSERYQLTDENGKPLTRGGTTEHTLLNEASNLLGTSTPADELWDNVRSLDYLTTRPEVDTSRIGCAGNSGGAMQAIYFAGYDNRIKAVAPCSYVSSRERTLELTGPADGCAQIPGEGKAQLEFADYLMMCAPRPVLILAGRYDFIDYRGTEDAYQELKKAYTVLGHPEKIALFAYDDGHGISKPKREALVSWFCRWLGNEKTDVKELPSLTRTAKELMVTNTGQLSSSIAGEKSIAQRNLQLFDFLSAKRKSFSQKTNTGKVRSIMELTDAGFDQPVMFIERKGDVVYRNIRYKKQVWRAAGELPVPVLIARPQGKIIRTMVVCPEEGKGKFADNEQLIESWLSSGFMVLLCDLRGIGETEDKPGLNDPKYYNREYRNAMLSLHIGSALPAQRMSDIQIVLGFLRSDKQFVKAPVELWASGITCIPALHALAMDPDIAAAHLSKAIRSYREILQQPAARDWYSYVIPGVLQVYDLPDLEAWAGKDRVRYEN